MGEILPSCLGKGNHLHPSSFTNLSHHSSLFLQMLCAEKLSTLCSTALLLVVDLQLGHVLPGMSDALNFHLRWPESSLSQEVLYQANCVVDELREIGELAYGRLDLALLKVHEFEQVSQLWWL
jgi:hypothetical protein